MKQALALSVLGLLLAGSLSAFAAPEAQTEKTTEVKAPAATEATAPAKRHHGHKHSKKHAVSMKKESNMAANSRIKETTKTSSTSEMKTKTAENKNLLTPKTTTTSHDKVKVNTKVR